MEKKNTILLTVIAIATLLVAAVGATFAYFTAQGGASSDAKINVATGTAASSTLGTYSVINIYADMSNFTEGAGDQTGTSEGTVSWTAPGATSTYTPTEADRTMCYTASLTVDANDFVYTTDDETPELTLTATKGGTVVLQDKDITTGTATVQIPTELDGTDYTHKLVAEAGRTVSDTWELTVTLHNLSSDQSACVVGDGSDCNTGKTFTGKVTFEKTTCPSA